MGSGITPICKSAPSGESFHLYSPAESPNPFPFFDCIYLSCFIHNSIAPLVPGYGTGFLPIFFVTEGGGFSLSDHMNQSQASLICWIAVVR
jgi:hypothetical protein